MVRCVGCGGQVPESTGPTHAYLQAAPGCWRLFGELNARAYAAPQLPALHAHAVDCYAVQHPGGAEHDRRQRQSVAVHLVALCLLVEHGQPVALAAARRGRTSRAVLGHPRREDWPHLPAPADLGAVTAAEVHASASPEQFADRLQSWTTAVWQAWAAHHDTVRGWAAQTAGGRS
jgi:hypothetical protein